MRKSVINKVLSVTFAGMLITAALAGCGKTEVPETAAEATEVVAEAAETVEAVQTTNEEAQNVVAEGVYFTTGVYANYLVGADEKTYFYVFENEEVGHTDDGVTGVGLPFTCEQEEGKVTFTFGGDGDLPMILNVTSIENGVVTGNFGDEKELVFEPVAGVDPTSFIAENYINAPEESVFYAPNGWSCKYNSTLFEVTQQDGNVFFVYTGESAGTNMITVTYDIEHKSGEEAIKALGESWGDKTSYSEITFPGTEDVKGYYASLFPEEGAEGSGLYSEAFGRDYMDGALIFEVTGHRSGDEALDMAVSDSIAMIFDTISFDF
jgi:hypothetical protein